MLATPVLETMPRHSGKLGHQKIWIDLDNSPHVPFFVPIIEELEKRGYSVMLTARNCAQVFELVDFFDLTCKRVGRHYGKNRIAKLGGLCLRALRLFPSVLKERPDLALSHCSRSQLMVSAVLGIPSLVLGDYEFSKAWVFVRPTWLMCPAVIPEAAVNCDRNRILKYPGIKEDVYVPRFKPDPSIQAHLGLKPEDLVITLRTPADDAHYHNPQSDELFRAVVAFLGRQPHVKMVLLPRNEKQGYSARQRWGDLFVAGKIIIPEHVVDGLNLIWHSDLVISGGGTMNREAAALGVPVYSIFRGKIGAVDRYLAEQDRLILIENAEEIHTKIILARRNRPSKPVNGNRPALQTIVENIVAILESKCPATHPSVQ